MFRLMLILTVAASYTFSNPISSESENSDAEIFDINSLNGDDLHSKGREGEVVENVEAGSENVGVGGENVGVGGENVGVGEVQHNQEKGPDHIGDFIEMLGKKILKYVKYIKEKHQNSVSFRRSKVQEAIQPDIVYFEKKKPSVVLQVDTKAAFNIVADALKANSVQTVVSDVARRAAEAYNDLKEKKML